MSDEDDAYLRAIEKQFLALKGRGYALSARDVGRVLDWRSEGVPLRLVVGQLNERFRARDAQRAPITLAHVRRGVDEAMRKRAERNVGAVGVSEPSVADRQQRIALLESTLASVGQRADALVRPTLRDAWRRLRELADAGESPWHIAEELDRLIGIAFAKLVDEPERVALEAAVDRRLSPYIDPETRAEKRALEVAKALRERFAVPVFLQVLLDGR